MTAESTGTRPAPVMPSLAPWLAVRGATEAVAFYQAAFGAEERYRLEDDAGGVSVAQLVIGSADFWLQQEDSGASPTPEDGSAVRLILTVADPDAVFAHAVAAGATVLGTVAEEHGWRSGRLADPFGHQWEIGRPLP